MVQIAVSTDAFLLMGDVNMDGVVNDADALRLQEHLLDRNEPVISFPQSDMDGSGAVDAFDLGMLKKKLGEDRVPVEYPLSFTQSEPGKWKIADDAAGRTVTCTFGGKGGYMATIVYGYWDTALNDGIGAWVQDDTTSFGSMKFNSDQEITVSFYVPETATSLQVQTPYYAVYENGTLTSLDLSGVTLKSVTHH